MLQAVQRRGRVEDEAGLAAVVADQLQRAVDVLAGFRMEADDVGAGLCKVGDDAVDRLDHQVHVDRHLHMRTDRFADERADGEVGDIMVIHHVEMDDVGAGSDDIADFLAEAGKVGRQDAGRDAVGGHAGLPEREAGIVPAGAIRLLAGAAEFVCNPGWQNDRSSARRWPLMK